MTRRTLILAGILTLLAGAVAFAAPTNAVSSFNTKDNGAVTLAKGQTHDGAYYAGAQDIVINGTINGDLYCAGQTLQLNGTVNGDVICGVQKAVINGTVSQDVRLAGQLITVSGQVGGSLTTFGQDINLTKGATVGGDLNGGGQTFTIDGTVKQDIALGAQTIAVSGLVEGSAAVSAESIQLSSSPAIKGGLEYTGATKQDFPADAVAGPVKFTEAQASNQDGGATALISFAALVAIASIVTSVVLVLVMPRYFERSYAVMHSKLGKTILTGVLAVLGLPVLALLLAISGVGIMLSVLVLAVLLVLNILAFPFAAYGLGRALFGQVIHNVILLMLAGSILLAILLLIPILNIFVYLALVIFGIGGALVTLTNGYRKPQYSITQTAIKTKK